MEKTLSDVKAGKHKEALQVFPNTHPFKPWSRGFYISSMSDHQALDPRGGEALAYEFLNVDNVDLYYDKTNSPED